MHDLDDILDNFEALEPGEERYRYLIELGRGLEGVPDDLKRDEHIVRGCQSRVWMIGRVEDGVVRVQADSDAFIVRGLIAILLAVFDGKSAAEVLTLDAQAVFAQVGLEQHLSMGRRNGLHAMVQRIRAIATLDGSEASES